MKKRILSLVLTAVISLSLIHTVMAEESLINTELAKTIGLSDNLILVNGWINNLNEGVCVFDGNNSDIYDKESPRLYGYKNLEGKVIINPCFSSASSFNDGLAYAVTDGCQFGGYIDITGKYIIPPVFNMGRDFINGKAIVFINNGNTIINKKGEFLLSKKYDNIQFDDVLLKYICRNEDQIDLLNEDLTVAKSFDYRDLSFQTIDGKTYIYFRDTNNNRGVEEYDSGRVIVPPLKSNYIQFQNDVFLVSYYDDQTTKVYDKNGTLKATLDTLSVLPLSEDKFYIFDREKDEKYIYEDGTRQDTELYITGQLSETLFEICNQNIYNQYDEQLTSLYGAVDKDGKLVIPMEYEQFIRDYGAYGYGYFTPKVKEIFAYKEGNIYSFDKAGKPIRHFEGKPIDLMKTNQYAFAYLDLKDTYYVLDKNLDVCFSVKCNDFKILDNDSFGNVRVYIDGQQYTIINKNSDCIKSPSYDTMVPVRISFPKIFTEDKTIFFKVGSNKKCVNTRFELLDYEVYSTAPIISNDRMLVPIRLFSDCLNDAYIYWDDVSKKVTAHTPGKTITFIIDSKDATLKYFDANLSDYVTKEIVMDEPAQIINDRTFIPLRVVSESLGFDVYWDEVSQLIGVGTSKIAPSAEQIASLTQNFEKGIATVQELQRMDASLATQPYLDYISANLLGVDHGTVNGVSNYSNTIPGYEALIRGEKDLILVTEPSADIIEQAKQNGVELEIVPFSKEGFVFLVNAQNSIKSLTQQQLRDIYQGKITNWKEVGGSDLPIIAYQRNENSGSQTIMENIFMKDITMINPLTRRIQSMMGLIDVVAEFNENEGGGLGYSVYYYAREMVGNPNVNLIALDGIAPSSETIRDNSYPIIVNYYAVKRKDDHSTTTKKLLDFVMSDEGQACVDESGLVSMR